MIFSWCEYPRLHDGTFCEVHNCSINLLKFKPKSTSNQQTLAFCFISRAMLIFATTMPDRAFRLSSNWSYFSEECDRLKMVFPRLDYPDKLVNYTIPRFISDKASDQPTSRLPAATNGQDPVRIVLAFKDQVSADIVRTQLNDLSQKIHKTIQPVFVSQKINQHLKLREAKPPLVNQQSLVYQFKCDLCDAGYLGFTRRHLHQRVDEHRHTSSSIGKHFRDKLSSTPKDLTSNFTILKKCNSKFDCHIYQMFINELRPSLKSQCTM